MIQNFACLEFNRDLLDLVQSLSLDSTFTQEKQQGVLHVLSEISKLQDQHKIFTTDKELNFEIKVEDLEAFIEETQ